MLELPGRQELATLESAARAIAPTAAVGFSRRLDGGRIGVTYVYPHGIGGFDLAGGDTPQVLRPGEGDGPSRAADAGLLAHSRDNAMEAFLLNNQTARLLSFDLVGATPPACFWVALTGDATPAPRQLAELDALAARAATVLAAPLSPGDRLSGLTRLDLAADLIPALLRVLDVREVIERLSATAKRALPHDLLLLNLFSEDLSTFTVYARSDQGAGLGMVRPNLYPASTILAWTFSVIDDHRLHPMERDAPSTKIGVRSSLRFPVRFDDRVIGGVTFASFTPHAYSSMDVAVGQRLAEHVASAISHFQLAGQLAEQAARAEELRAQRTNLELLDGLLEALADTGDLADMFDRISAIAAKVLPHDAAALVVQLADGQAGRVYARSGYPRDLPNITGAPEDVFDDPDWDHDIYDDVTPLDGPLFASLRTLGLKAFLRVPIRFDGRIGGALTFAAKAAGAFTQADLLPAHRLADRMAVTLARSRELEAARRADEASERAARLEARVQALTEELDGRTGYRRIIGESPSWKRALTQATQVSATDTTALLLGESGTGKEVVARFVHRASPRGKGPFVALNCAALPDQLLEAELFGYERGAFTGATQSKPGQLEQAAGGTLFLDEVGEMSLQAQAKFLRVLQEREFQRLGGTRVLRSDARIIAATNRDLQQAMAHGQFREDLFYRLNVFAIRLPALRDRRDDVLPLTLGFLTEFGRTFAHPPAGISREARQALLDYDWPGNIRELRNILERAAILCDGGLITVDHLALSPPPPPPRTAPAPSGPAAPDAAEVAPRSADAPGDLRSMERSMIERALQHARFNKSKAAKELGLSRHQLYIRMRRLGLEP